MKNKGTGWIPDYPDINDFTLQTDAIQNLTNRIYSQNETASIDNLAQNLCKVLNSLEQQQQEIGRKNPELTKIKESLEKEIFGNNSNFVTVKLHNVFQKGMADSEILLIKNYLQRILWIWKPFDSSTKIDGIIDGMKINDTTFNSETREILIQVIETQYRLKYTMDGSVGKDEIEAIKELADLSTIDSPFFLRNLTERWKQWSDHIYKQTEQTIFKKQCLSDFQNGQIKFVIHLFTMLEILYDDNLNSSNKSTILKEEEEIKKIKGKIKQLISYLQDPNHKEGIINGVLCITRNHSNRRLNDNAIYYNDGAKAYEEFKQLLDPLCGISDVQNDKWVNDTISELQKLLDDQQPDIKEKVKKKIYELQKLIKTAYQINPPQIPPQRLEEIKISIESPIPSQIRKLLKKELISEKSSVSTPDEKKQTHKEIQTLIYLIIEFISQALIPLAKHSNLSQTVERVVDKIYCLIEKDHNEETKKLIRGTVEEYNFRSVNTFDLIEETDFLNLILGIIIQKLDLQIKATNQDSQFLGRITEAEKKAKEKEKFSTHLQPILEASKNTCRLIYLLLKKLSESEDTELAELRKSVQIKKPLFEIQDAKRQIISNDLNHNLCHQTENNLQFPINYQLRIQLEKALTSDSQKEKEKDEQKRIFLLLPEFVDLSYWCSPIEDQGTINSCTAHAGIALMEYAENRSSGNYTDGSALFLYKATRNLMQREGDSGASVRDTMKAMVAFGVCPENYWSYDEDKFDEEPTPFCYSFAENYKTLKYFRLDYGRISKYALLSQVKVLLAAELPCIFGFTLYKSVYNEANTVKGYIPLPNQKDRVIGGHTVVAVGYHDRKIVENTDGDKSEGALLIRNSWGTRWGEGGYGWLPYDYIVKGLTADWWSLLKAEWLASGRFGAGASAWNADRGGNQDKPPKQPGG